MQHYLGEITALDRAVGQLRETLRDLDIADSTIVIFCSDNGAQGPGSTGGLRGRKGTLYEGGVRVPAILEWPAHIKKGRTTEIPCVTSDFLPTFVDLLDIEVKNPVRPLDGISITELIEGNMKERSTPIAFWRFRGTKGDSYLPPDQLKGWWRTFTNRTYSNPRTENFPGHAVLMDNRFKLHQLGAKKYELYDIVADPKESQNLAKKHPDIVQRMSEQLHEWQRSVEKSLTGADYKKK